MDFATSVVRIPKMSEMVAAQIRKRILRGELKPGDYLAPEPQLVEDFGVARATVREAMRILEAEDLLRISRGARRGAQIRQPSQDMVARTVGIALQTRGGTIGDVFRARIGIEPVAARFAAEFNPVEGARRLSEQVEAEERVVAARDGLRMNELLGQFHRTLMDCSGNITLSLLGTSLEGLVTGHLSLLYQRDADRHDDWWVQMALSVRSRRKLVRLIGEGDAAGAGAHWALHMENTARHWLGRVSQTALVDILQ